MAQATRNLDIHEAAFGYMYGTIELTVNPSRDRYYFAFGGGDSLNVKKWDREKNLFGRKESITHEAAVKLLGDRHWDWSDFVAVWQGWASGYERGVYAGKEEARKEATLVSA